ncbi:MAG: LysR family transcriptional regulator [Qingshengfaniella sp.]
MSQYLTHAQFLQRLLLKGRLRQLQMVVSVAQAGSMQQAARDLAISQPSITKAVAELETDLGMALFERHARGMRLTRSGARILPDLQRILDSTDRFAQAVAAQHDAGSSILRVASVAAGISGVLAGHAPSFCRDNPDIVLSIDEIDGRQILNCAARDEFDIFICRTPETTPEGWIFTPAEPDEHAILAAPSHPLTTAANVTLEALHACTWLMPPAGVPAEALLAEIFAGYPPLRMAQLPTRSRTMNRASLQQLGLVSIAPLSIFRSELENRTLARIDFALSSKMPPLGVLRPRVSTGTAMDRFCALFPPSQTPAS